ncbi:MAG: helix-turn-helix transcriptional regulator [Planctomycetes bacterium]|nr:helix-turn-helix transcriptional regulator [Planctomycetota bacterium]
MDLIVATFRALANPVRLRLLLLVHSEPGITVHALAERAKILDHAASRHLKVLAEYRLVHTAASGRYVECFPAREGSTSNAFLRDVQRLLRRLLGGEDLNRTPSKVCDLVEASERTWDAVFAALMKQFTAYTHLRRLMMVRHLALHRPCGMADLVSGIGMSEDACRRHLDKLERRYLARQAGRGGDWELIKADHRTMRGILLGIVLDGLDVQ